jgi:5,10-methenyltetrahydrofolate synthetase
MNDAYDDRSPGFASPACSMHEVDPAYTGLEPVDPAVALKRWRKAERERLLAERLAIAAERRTAHSRRIAAGLDTLIGDLSGVTVSAYWPFRGEPDLRDWLRTVRARGGRTALPVVVERRRPLVFRIWNEGDALERGIWNILVPSSAAEAVIPDVVIAPVVGFDPDCYRLGYGGGYYDRTLAAMPRKPRAFGVGYETALIRTIFPQPHDIRLDSIVTDTQVHSPADSDGKA